MLIVAMPQKKETSELSAEHRKAIQKAVMQMYAELRENENEVATRVGVSQQAINKLRNHGAGGRTILDGLLDYLGMTEGEFMRKFHDPKWDRDLPEIVARVLENADLPATLPLEQRAEIAKQAKSAYASNGKITTAEVDRIVKAVRKSGVTVNRDE